MKDSLFSGGVVVFILVNVFTSRYQKDVDLLSNLMTHASICTNYLNCFFVLGKN